MIDVKPVISLGPDIDEHRIQIGGTDVYITPSRSVPGDVMIFGNYYFKIYEDRIEALCLDDPEVRSRLRSILGL